jgi:Flp pilus assembly protein TadD
MLYRRLGVERSRPVSHLLEEYMTDNQTTTDVDTLVGQAWSKHYHGDNEAAIQEFRDLVAKWPEHIDANYGLSLSLKAAGQKQAASDAFNKTKSLVDAARTSQGDENARYTMLSRMIEQQLVGL